MASSPSLRLRLTLEEVAFFLDTAFPAADRPWPGEVVSLDLNHLRMKLEPTRAMLRPGDIVSGPTIFGLADVAAYAVIAAHHGPEAMAVTSSLSISFLRACQFETVMADARLLKLGRRIASVDVRVWQRQEERLIAQSTLSYAIP